MPLGLLYFLSDLLYFLLYVLLHYRRSVVRMNLVNSFPGRPIAEIKKIERNFYRHLCDMIIESIRLFSMPEKELHRRCHLKNPEVMNDLYQQGKSVILAAGHYNNWEMSAVILPKKVKHEIIGIYTPLKDPFLDRKLKESRERFGMRMIPRSAVKEEFEKNMNVLTATLFATDQSPTFSKVVHWTNFLHQPTAVLTGTERFAKEYNLPVLYAYISKPRRGHYLYELKLLEANPAGTEPGEITEKHTRWLEAQIENTPQYWLWTHKRWKRKLREDEKLYRPS